MSTRIFSCGLDGVVIYSNKSTSYLDRFNNPLHAAGLNRGFEQRVRPALLLQLRVQTNQTHQLRTVTVKQTKSAACKTEIFSLRCSEEREDSPLARGSDVIKSLRSHEVVFLHLYVLLFSANQLDFTGYTDYLL